MHHQAGIGHQIDRVGHPGGEVGLDTQAASGQVRPLEFRAQGAGAQRIDVEKLDVGAVGAVRGAQRQAAREGVVALQGKALIASSTDHHNAAGAGNGGVGPFTLLLDDKGHLNILNMNKTVLWST